MDLFEGELNAPSSLHKYVYGANDPINRIDPSGLTTIQEEQTVVAEQSNLASRLGHSISRQYSKTAKERQWVIWRVQLKNGIPWYEHTYIWAQNIRTKRGIGYHVPANMRAAALARELRELIPGVLLVMPQSTIDFGGTFPVASKAPVAILTKKQFVVWNAVSVSAGVIEMFDGLFASPFPYRIPDSNCKAWTEDAVRNAILIGATPF